MKLADAKRIFREEYADFIKEHKNDVIMLNLAWTQFLDSLNRNGEITDKQFANAGNSFRRKDR